MVARAPPSLPDGPVEYDEPPTWVLQRTAFSADVEPQSERVTEMLASPGSLHIACHSDDDPSGPGWHWVAAALEVSARP
jgi:hypothetical protein